MNCRETLSRREVQQGLNLPCSLLSGEGTLPTIILRLANFFERLIVRGRLNDHQL